MGFVRTPTGQLKRPSWHHNDGLCLHFASEAFEYLGVRRTYGGKNTRDQITQDVLGPG